MSADVGDNKEDINGINITPLVDVCLVLVLIFMMTMPLSLIHGIDVKRQAVAKYGLSTPQENVTVHLTARGPFIRDNRGREQAVPFEDFGMVLGQMVQASAGKQVFLKVDRDVPHGQTVWALDISKQNGAKDISLME